MIFKFLTIYFISLTLIFMFLLGFLEWHGSDIEFQHYTALRMHACDIVKNDHSSLSEFNPGKCEVRRRPMWIGEIIDVTCTANGNDGKEHRFSYSYSDVHRSFNYFFKRYALGSRGGDCNG